MHAYRRLWLCGKWDIHTSGGPRFTSLIRRTVAESVQNLTPEKSRRVGKALHVMVTHPCGERARWSLDFPFEYCPLQGTCSAAAKVSPFARVSLFLKLQALVYDILPWSKVSESDVRSGLPIPVSWSLYFCSSKG